MANDEVRIEPVETGPEGRAAPRIVLNESLDLPHLPYTVFVERLVGDRLPHALTFQWMTETEGIDSVLPFAASTGRGMMSQIALLDLGAAVGGECIAYVNLRLGAVFGHLAARELPVLAEAETWMRSCFPKAEPAEDRTIPLTFWSVGSQGAHAVSRRITVPAWADISGNYSGRVRGEIEALLSREFHPSGGQLVLWYGPPGTGKTHALRALAWEWRAWCEAHYVTDPEQFFGRSAYMLDVLLKEDEDGDDDTDAGQKWRLLILEDTGELLASDAKEQAGQGLSRLLNVVDGIIGQGLRVLVLVTTNEPLVKLHPAISRPGRCAAKIEFGPLSRAESADWLAAHGTGAQARELTLAELFALSNGLELEESVRLGFAP